MEWEFVLEVNFGKSGYPNLRISFITDISERIYTTYIQGLETFETN